MLQCIVRLDQRRRSRPLDRGAQRPRPATRLFLVPSATRPTAAASIHGAVVAAEVSRQSGLQKGNDPLGARLHVTILEKAVLQ